MIELGMMAWLYVQ